MRNNVFGDDFYLVNVLEASSSSFSQTLLLQPLSLHCMSLSLSDFFCPSLWCWDPWASVHRLTFTLPPGNLTHSQDFHPPPCADVGNSSLPPYPLLKFHLSSCLLDVPSWQSHRHLQTPLYHFLHKPALPPELPELMN